MVRFTKNGRIWETMDGLAIQQCTDYADDFVRGAGRRSEPWTQAFRTKAGMLGFRPTPDPENPRRMIGCQCNRVHLSGCGLARPTCKVNPIKGTPLETPCTPTNAASAA